MPRSNFAVLSSSFDDTGIVESIEAVSGTGSATGSTNCLAIEFDGVIAGASRVFCYFVDLFNEGDASSDIYIDRYTTDAQPMLIARVPLHMNPNIDMDNLFTGYVVKFDPDTAGAINLERWFEGGSSVITSVAATFFTTGGVWQRWRMTVVDEGADVRIKIQQMTGGSWTTAIDFLDEASPLAGQRGAFGFGFEQINMTSTADPAIRFDDWKCERILA